MKPIEEIIAINGGDNTPIGDSHNLTGRVIDDGLEWDTTLRAPDMTGLAEDFEDILWEDDYLMAYAPLATFDELGALGTLPEDACE